MADSTYTGQGAIYREQGNNELVVASGGLITLDPGSGISGPAEVVTAANVLTAAESGTTYYLSLAVGFLTTLPTPALGLRYTFIVAIAPTGGAGYTIGGGTANNIHGSAVGRDGAAGVAGAGEDTITLVNDGAIIGDRVDLECDGTNWYARAQVDVAAGITFTT